MVNRRKPISFNTTLRNPERIPQFISVLREFEGKKITDNIALEIEAELIRQKVFEPTESTLGKYVKEYSKKFKFVARDQSDEAIDKVNRYFKEWKISEKGQVEREKIIYLLNNTITAHAERGWRGGWESRLATQYTFLNELGFVKFIKNEELKISDTGKLMIKEYENGYPKNDHYNISYEQSAFLMAFAKYQINNPYRFNTINVNFFTLVLNVINYLDEKYGRPGISRDDLPFIIAWGNNDYKELAEIIYLFRKKFGYNISKEVIYDYAMNLLDDKSKNLLKPASKEFIKSKGNDYKFTKITHETPDEIIRKLRLTMLVSLRGAGRFIDINKNEISKIKYIIENYSENKKIEDLDEYLEYMGSVDSTLLFEPEKIDSKEEKDAKKLAISKWAQENEWDYLKQQVKICIGKGKCDDPVLRYVKETARLEFLSAIIIKKALPDIVVEANYKADDQGIPFNTASGGVGNRIGADIDVFENEIHALLEPTLATSRSFQVEHELPSIRNHIIETAKYDIEKSKQYNEWFGLFIAHNISRDVGDQVGLIKHLNGVEIYPWDIEDFVIYSESVTSIRDYKVIRNYAKPQRMPTS